MININMKYDYKKNDIVDIFDDGPSEHNMLI